ncbi:MAG: cobalamin-dependent protein, partial [Desulfosudaceae bacterium]
MADIVLIYPLVGDMDIIREKPHLPLALIQAASLVSRHYRVKIIDLRLLADWREALSRELAASPLLAGFSVMSGLPLASALEVSRYIRQNSDIPVVWGGNHPTLSPAETLADPDVDIVVIGDGEETLLEMTDRLAAGKTLEGVKGLWA